MNILSFKNGSILEPPKKIPCKSLSHFSVAKAFSSVESNGKTKKGMKMNLNPKTYLQVKKDNAKNSPSNLQLNGSSSANTSNI